MEKVRVVVHPLELPRDLLLYVICSGMEAGYFPDYRVVYCNVRVPSAELILLHEMGHARCHEECEHFRSMDRYEQQSNPRAWLTMEACAWRSALRAVGRPLTREERVCVREGFVTHRVGTRHVLPRERRVWGGLGA